MGISWVLDTDEYDGMGYAWTHPSRSGGFVSFSGLGSQAYKRLDPIGEPTVQNLEHVLFIREKDSEEVVRDKMELLFEWKAITEERQNALLHLRRRLSFPGAQAFVDVAFGELEEAGAAIRNLISRNPDVWFPTKEERAKDSFLQSFAEDLMKGLLEKLRTVSDPEVAGKLVHDLRLLTAVILDKGRGRGRSAARPMTISNI